ncbi:uncharacterized protein LOC131285020 [Anopheles ziemanni]|uniref:uncharacterized protein LOC131262963 n=1 Tax=Anopheles coustani TaxID=139045 RepID=UPI00265988E1|nr:uncharacterized protein LOC131262963 [Anopheles coustani]XP_058169863.1 uncharacterized protein LOC131285020 [Anopheles ziemanni]
MADSFQKRQLERPTALVVLVALLGVAVSPCAGSCYFPFEFQGGYVTQNTVTAEGAVRYSRINITENAIPLWGMCHKRRDNNVILMTGTEEASCYRCFHLKLVSKNVLRVLAADQDYISKCHTNEEKALASCLTEDDLLNEAKHTEIILYKYNEWDGAEVRQEYCPIHGRYRMAYSVDSSDNGDGIECDSDQSTVDNCPSGAALNLRFRNCAFPDREVTFECLGHWQGSGGQNYLALLSTATEGAHLGPKYRCATYTENAHTGEIEISFSRDSTCRSIERQYVRHPNSRYTNGNGIGNEYHHEVLSLRPIPLEFGPVTQYCSFPSWLIGRWEHVIVSQNQLIYKDHNTFKTYTMKCVKNYTNHDSNKYIVYSQTQCGEEMYQCLKVERRDTNVFEFQISNRQSANYSATICNDFYFSDDRWLTQGRLGSNDIVSPCPIIGEFSGIIPDDEGLCAKLSSECESQDIMYYQISACDYTNEVYEEREYRCLGQWTHRNIVYTYTQRRDVGTYECFVGTMHSDRQIFIKEAGEHCQRDVNPHRFGMELNKVAHCTPPEVFKSSARPTHKYSDVLQPTQRPANTINSNTNNDIGGHGGTNTNGLGGTGGNHPHQSSSPSVVSNSTPAPSSAGATTGRSSSVATGGSSNSGGTDSGSSSSGSYPPYKTNSKHEPASVKPGTVGSTAANVQSHYTYLLLLATTFICVILGRKNISC